MRSHFLIVGLSKPKSITCKIVAAKIKSLIRNHYTPKTVEENETDLSEYILMKISDEYPYMIFESKAKDGTIVAEPIKEMLCFRGSKSECEAEKKRLESLTKGREEKGEFFCDSIDKGGDKCASQCGFCCVFQPTESNPTPNRDNYRAENDTAEILIKIRKSVDNFELDTCVKRIDTLVELIGYLNLAIHSNINCKALKQIDKEVKSNPEAE